MSATGYTLTCPPQIPISISVQIVAAPVGGAPAAPVDITVASQRKIFFSSAWVDPTATIIENATPYVVRLQPDGLSQTFFATAALGHVFTLTSTNDGGLADPAPQQITAWSNYFTDTSDSDAIASNLLNLAAYFAANTATKLAALHQATLEVDRGMRFQGRKFVFTQDLEFPRAAYDSSRRALTGIGPIGPAGFGVGDIVWDWDENSNSAAVPRSVLEAVIFQANSILQNERPARLDAIHDGVMSQETGSLGEKYDRTAPGVKTSLCRRSWDLLKRYRIVSGRMV